MPPQKRFKHDNIRPLAHPNGLFIFQSQLKAVWPIKTPQKNQPASNQLKNSNKIKKPAKGA
jgi:hypothetical protein